MNQKLKLYEVKCLGPRGEVKSKFETYMGSEDELQHFLTWCSGRYSKVEVTCRCHSMTYPWRRGRRCYSGRSPSARCYWLQSCGACGSRNHTQTIAELWPALEAQLEQMLGAPETWRERLDAVKAPEPARAHVAETALVCACGTPRDYEADPCWKLNLNYLRFALRPPMPNRIAGSSIPLRSCRNCGTAYLLKSTPR